MKSVLTQENLQEIQFLLKLMPITHFDIVHKITKIINASIVTEEMK
jgi:hypothetical protein